MPLLIHVVVDQKVRMLPPQIKTELSIRVLTMPIRSWNRSGMNVLGSKTVHKSLKIKSQIEVRERKCGSTAGVGLLIEVAAINTLDLKKLANITIT